MPLDGRRPALTIFIGALIVAAGFIVGAPREGVVMLTTLFGITIWVYGCYRWAQGASAPQLIAWGIIAAAASSVISRTIVPNVDDWSVAVWIAAAAAAVVGAAFAIVGTWRWARDHDSHLPKTLR